MSTVDTHAVDAGERRARTAEEDQQFAAQLAENTLVVRLSKSHLGVYKALNAEQHRQQAELFNADAEYVKGRKKLFNTRHEKIQRVGHLLLEATEYWKSATRPYPEPKMRLIARDKVDEFDRAMEARLDAITDAIAEAEEVYQDEIIPQQRERLGDLFDRNDYPSTLVGQWSLDWDWPTVEPSDELKELHPRLYEQERQRAEARWNEAVRLTEIELRDRMNRKSHGSVTCCSFAVRTRSSVSTAR
jgi:hypothetical protein